MDTKLLACGYYVCDRIAAHINNVKPNTEKNFCDTQSISDFVKAHNLVSIYGCLDDKTSFSSDVSNLILKQMKLDHMCDKISNKFCEKQVPHIVLKGKEFQRFYPNSIVRNSSDIDFYIDEKYVETATNILTDFGFTHEKTNNNNEFEFTKEPVYNVELHTTIGGFSEKQKKLLSSLYHSTNVSDSYRHSLTDTAFYIHAMFHLYKHFVLSGVGVRLFLDLYLTEKNGNIDYGYADRLFKELDIYGFVQTVRKINNVLFENHTANNELSEVIEFVFDSGIFGKATTTRHLNRFNYSTKHTTKFQRFVQKHGISFDLMSRRYPVLKKAPVLYPFSFIHRFFYGIIFRRDVLKNEKSVEKSILDEDTQKYKRIFEIAKIK